METPLAAGHAGGECANAEVAAEGSAAGSVSDNADAKDEDADDEDDDDDDDDELGHADSSNDDARDVVQNRRARQVLGPESREQQLPEPKRRGRGHDADKMKEVRAAKSLKNLRMEAERAKQERDQARAEKLAESRLFQEGGSAADLRMVDDVVHNYATSFRSLCRLRDVGKERVCRALVASGSCVYHCQNRLLAAKLELAQKNHGSCVSSHLGLPQAIEAIKSVNDGDEYLHAAMNASSDVDIEHKVEEADSGDEKQPLKPHDNFWVAETWFHDESQTTSRVAAQMMDLLGVADDQAANEKEKDKVKKKDKKKASVAPSAAPTEQEQAQAQASGSKDSAPPVAEAEVLQDGVKNQLIHGAFATHVQRGIYAAPGMGRVAVTCPVLITRNKDTKSIDAVQRRAKPSETRVVKRWLKRKRVRWFHQHVVQDGHGSNRALVRRNVHNRGRQEHHLFSEVVCTTHKLVKASGHQFNRKKLLGRLFCAVRTCNAASNRFKILNKHRKLVGKRYAPFDRPDNYEDKLLPSKTFLLKLWSEAKCGMKRRAKGSSDEPSTKTFRQEVDETHAQICKEAARADEDWRERDITHTHDDGMQCCKSVAKGRNAMIALAHRLQTELKHPIPAESKFVGLWECAVFTLLNLCFHSAGADAIVSVCGGKVTEESLDRFVQELTRNGIGGVEHAADTSTWAKENKVRAKKTVDLYLEESFGETLWLLVQSLRRLYAATKVSMRDAWEESSRDVLLHTEGAWSMLNLTKHSETNPLIQLLHDSHRNIVDCERWNHFSLWWHHQDNADNLDAEVVEEIQSTNFSIGSFVHSRMVPCFLDSMPAQAVRAVDPRSTVAERRRWQTTLYAKRHCESCADKGLCLPLLRSMSSSNDFERDDCRGLLQNFSLSAINNISMERRHFWNNLGMYQTLGKGLWLVMMSMKYMARDTLYNHTVVKQAIMKVLKEEESSRVSSSSLEQLQRAFGAEGFIPDDPDREGGVPIEEAAAGAGEVVNASKSKDEENGAGSADEDEEEETLITNPYFLFRNMELRRLKDSGDYNSRMMTPRTTEYHEFKIHLSERWRELRNAPLGRQLKLEANKNKVLKKKRREQFERKRNIRNDEEDAVDAKEKAALLKREHEDKINKLMLEKNTMGFSDFSQPLKTEIMDAFMKSVANSHDKRVAWMTMLHEVIGGPEERYKKTSLDPTCGEIGYCTQDDSRYMPLILCMKNALSKCLQYNCTWRIAKADRIFSGKEYLIVWACVREKNKPQAQSDKTEGKGEEIAEQCDHNEGHNGEAVEAAPSQAKKARGRGRGREAGAKGRGRSQFKLDTTKKKGKHKAGLGEMHLKGEHVEEEKGYTIKECFLFVVRLGPTGPSSVDNYVITPWTACQAPDGNPFWCEAEVTITSPSARKFNEYGITDYLQTGKLCRKVAERVFGTDFNMIFIQSTDRKDCRWRFTKLTAADVICTLAKKDDKNEWYLEVPPPTVSRSSTLAVRQLEEFHRTEQMQFVALYLLPSLCMTTCQLDCT